MLLQTLLAGFNHTNPYRLIFPDDLPQAHKGDIQHPLKLTRDSWTDVPLRAVNSAVMRCPAFHGLRLPSEGLLTSWKFGQQQGALMKVLPPNLLALPGDPKAKDLATVMCGGSP